MVAVVSVRGVRHLAAGVADTRRDDAGLTAEQILHPPEAAPGEDRLFSHGVHEANVAGQSLLPKSWSSSRKMLRMSRKIDAASVGAVRMSLALRSRWKSYAVSPAKMTRPAME